MKNIFIALALITGAALTSTAQAKVAAPYWTCQLNADLFETTKSRDWLVWRDEAVQGYGNIQCKDLLGRESIQKVKVNVYQYGYGIAFNGPIKSLKIKAAAKGLSSVDGMIGKYKMAVGPRLGLIDSRVGVLAGIQVSGYSSGIDMEAVVEERESYGLELTRAFISIQEVSDPVITTRY